MAGAAAEQDSWVGGEARLVGGRYRVQAKLGHGAMGAVYRVTDESTGKDVALKRFSQQKEHPGDRLRFRREFHTLAGLIHPRIVEVYDFGVDDGDPYYTMELLDGQDFRDLAPVGPIEVCRLLRDVASALAFLHSRRLLHRDLAPRNVRSTSDGRAKLLDFGVMATMGVSNEVVGTLPCIAPETLLGVPLDQRSDLFGLGALGYWLLTGRHAQRVRSMEDLITRGQRQAAPPSSINKAVPPALDDLILSLVSADPLGRPATAAEVIDRVSAIGALDRVPELDDVAQGYVQSASMVGREREMSVIRKRVAKAAEGKGRSIVVRGRTGSGKTRLLDESGLEAKLGGAVLARSPGEAGGPYAVMRELAFDLITNAPEESRASAKSRAPLLTRAIPDLAEKLDLKVSAYVVNPRGDAREERLAVQRAFTGWLFDVALARPLVLLVDNLQRCDEASAAVLTTIAHEARRHRVLLMSALRTDEQVHAAGAVAKLRESSLAIRARGLAAADVERLVREMFGEVPNSKLLASWMRDVAGGSPLRLTEVARHIVDRGQIRYVDGMWVLPEKFDDTDLPRGTRRTLDARVDRLGPRALELARVLAVHGGEVELETCVALAGTDEHEAVFAALDELVGEQILVGSGGRHRFRQEGLREALVRGVSEDERPALELRVGRVLVERGDIGPEDDARVGWHLLRGGDEDAGAERLARAGRRLVEATSFSDAILPLEAALDVYNRRPDHNLDRVELSAMLVMAGFFSDRACALRHRDPAIELVGHYAGINRARRLRRVLPGRLAMMIGLVLAIVLHWTKAKAKRGPRPVVAIEMYLRCLAYSTGASAFSYDTEGLRWAVERFDPLATLPRQEIHDILRFVTNLRDFNLGRFRSVKEATDRGLLRVEEARGEVNEAEMNVGVGGARYQRGLMAVRSGSKEALAEIEGLEALDSRLWDMGALQLRSIYHQWRGSEEEATRIWAEAELDFVRLGSLWQLEATLNSTGAASHAYVGDMLALKRCIATLSRLVDQGLSYQQHLGVARGAYLRLRGELDESRQVLERTLDLMPEGEGMMRPSALTALAETLLDAEDFEHAELVATKGRDHAANPEYAQILCRLRCDAIIAVARAERGRTEEAEKILQRVIVDAEAVENPVALGSAHEAAARVSLLAEDPALFSYHLAKVKAFFRSTQNPVLVARYERLARLEASEERPPVTDDVATQIGKVDVGETAHSVLSQCVTPEERAQAALELLLSTTGASTGFFFMVNARRIELAAPLHGSEPPSGLARELLGSTRNFGNDDLFKTPLGELRTTDGRGWHPLVLVTRRGDRTPPVAAAALFRGAEPLRAPPEALLESIAKSLYEEGDAETAPSTATMTLREALDIANRRQR